MEELAYQYRQFKKALTHLKRMFKRYQQAFREVSTTVYTVTAEEDFIEFRSATIQAFECCYELVWKLLKSILKKRYSIESNSPRKVFNDSYAQAIIGESQAHMLIDMIEARNDTTHKYDELRADEIGKKIASYIELFELLEAKCADYCGLGLKQ
jgi:nucleotidyltransferase substrate binding protein (TIGR01987 family)